SIRDSLQAIVDSVLTAPDLDAFYPYVGANWDSTRFYLNQIVEHHANSPVVNQAKLLYTEIELPESIQKIVIDSLQSINTDSIDIDPSVADSVLQVLDTEISI